ncbi:hypothetical protein Hanom_Chr14g01324451 [Helianthus anomalus]
MGLVCFCIHHPQHTNYARLSSVSQSYEITMKMGLTIRCNRNRTVWWVWAYGFNFLNQISFMGINPIPKLGINSTGNC